jgi:predicted permease
LYLEIEEELQSHIAEAITEGRDPAEARRAFGSALRQGERSRDLRIVPWLDSLRADAIFGWRQMMKRKVASTAAILSLGLAIGACTSAFRLIDALLLRPLPIAAPERLYACYHQSIPSAGQPRVLDSYEYPLFREMRAAAKGKAELIAISYAEHVDLTYQSDDDIEKAYVQYVSGWMFGAFGLHPALGRLLTGSDDLTAGSSPYAVITYDYWTRRFGRDPKVIGRTLRIGGTVLEIAGVCEKRFTGVENGTVIDIFVPTMMNSGVNQADRGWIRILVRLHPGVSPESVRDRMRTPFRAFREGAAKRRFVGANQGQIDRFLGETLELASAGAGVSEMQRAYRSPLLALGVLVGLVLSMACANVANLLTAQAAGRAREMALRISIGAGKWRLVQLMLLESAWLTFLATVIGGVFAAWSTPFIAARINPPDDPARLILPVDWRVLGFALVLVIGATFLFGLAPALRASAIRPVSALKGGEDPRSRRRQMNALIAAQVGFCFLVLFGAGLFLATSERLSNLPTGFSAQRILLLDTSSQRGQVAALWEQAAERLRAVPGVESVALAGWPLLKGDAMIGSISVNGEAPSADLGYFIDVSPGWLDTMRIPLIGGRDFRGGDTELGAAIVNEAFAKAFFRGENPIGRYFEQAENHGGFKLSV